MKGKPDVTSQSKNTFPGPAARALKKMESGLHGEVLPAASNILRATACWLRAGGGGRLGTLEAYFTVAAQ